MRRGACVQRSEQASGDGRYNKILNDAKSFLTAMQYGEQPGETMTIWITAEQATQEKGVLIYRIPHT